MFRNDILKFVSITDDKTYGKSVDMFVVYLRIFDVEKSIWLTYLYNNCKMYPISNFILTVNYSSWKI